jgi:DNA-binding transcriptional MocR family regulator
MAGYIKLYRGSRETDGLLPSEHYSDWEAWTWLLEHAAWKELSRWNAKGEEIRLQPGQIHVSLRSLATAWGWSKSKVERFLSRLERVGKARQSTGQSGIVLTIENWAKYQGAETEGETPTGTASGQPRDTQEEGKERKEENNKGGYAFCGSVIRLNDMDFARWKAAYNRLDLKALLQSRDDWLAAQDQDIQRRWFQSTSNWLAKQQQEATSQAREVSRIKVGI